MVGIEGYHTCELYKCILNGASKCWLGYHIDVFLSVPCRFTVALTVREEVMNDR